MTWGSLRAVIDEAKAIAKEEREKPPAECPQDGEPLVYHAGKGLWHCKFDGYVTRKREL